LTESENDKYPGKCPDGICLNALTLSLVTAS